MSELEECCICLISIKDDKEYKTACNHRFHYKCIKQSVNAGNTDCPLCRRNLDLKKIFSIVNKIIENKTEYDSLCGVRYIGHTIIMAISDPDWIGTLESNFQLKLPSQSFDHQGITQVFGVGRLKNNENIVFRADKVKCLVSSLPACYNDDSKTLRVIIKEDHIETYKKIDDIMKNASERDGMDGYEYISPIRYSDKNCDYSIKVMTSHGVSDHNRFLNNLPKVSECKVILTPRVIYCKINGEKKAYGTMRIYNNQIRVINDYKYNIFDTDTVTDINTDTNTDPFALALASASAPPIALASASAPPFAFASIYAHPFESDSDSDSDSNNKKCDVTDYDKKCDVTDYDKKCDVTDCANEE